MSKNEEKDMSELIDRQAAIDIVVFECGEWIGLAKEISKQLKQLPSAQPERKTGRWIPHEDEDGEHYGDKCSECGEWYVMPYGKTNFCPNCGADMKGDTYE